jgi:hypothetical protein
VWEHAHARLTIIFNFSGGGLTVAFLKNPSKWFQKIGTANQNEEKSTKIVTKITP